jgi:hypothetical protein
MANQHHRSISFLLGAVALPAAAAGVCGLMPLMTCPECATPMDRSVLFVDQDKEEAKANRLGKTVLGSPLCLRCKDTRRVTLPRKLLYDLRAR